MLTFIALFFLFDIMPELLSGGRALSCFGHIINLSNDDNKKKNFE